MVLRTRPEEDDWQDVTDARKRKQIQDRLAQRARRRRLREAKGDIAASQHFLRFTLASDGSHHKQDAPNQAVLDLQRSINFELPSTSKAPSCQIIELADQGANKPAITDLQLRDNSQEPISWQLIDLNSRSDLPLLDPPTVDMSLADTSFTETPFAETSLTHPSLLPSNINALPSPLSKTLALPLTVFTALFLNGQILQIPCSTLLASKSPLPSPQTPLSLRPTASQLTTVHYQWIDRLPFPKLRDSLIRLQAVLDLDEFLEDIFLKPSFEIENGGRSWEAGKWKMEEGWREKWGWLFF
ncbi:hypothetical protein SVAN01_07741 [Stagonosporopsis vannaccii]|nr:hypothetical protein SVAN01_07741 [Stagonosporopsis vannaccii]